MYLHLFTDCFMKISLHSSEQNIVLYVLFYIILLLTVCVMSAPIVNFVLSMMGWRPVCTFEINKLNKTKLNYFTGKSELVKVYVEHGFFKSLQPYQNNCRTIGDVK